LDAGARRDDGDRVEHEAMDTAWVVLGLASLGIGIAWTTGLLADRGRLPAQRRNFKGQSLTGPTLAAVLWLLLGLWWLARGLLG
jgi:hypothetical protein